MKVSITEKILVHNEIYAYFKKYMLDPDRVQPISPDDDRVEAEIELAEDKNETLHLPIELLPFEYNIGFESIIYGPALYLQERTVYLGEMKEGIRHGLGFQIFEDGSLYEGEFLDDKATGRGRIIFQEGDIYEGEVVDFEMQGKGVYHRAIGDVMKGAFENDMPHGMMSVSYKDGARYEGQYIDGKKCGKGKFIFNDGTFYEGEFKEDLFHGFGMFYDMSQEIRFEGYWEMNNMISPVKIQYKNGSHYEGGVLDYKRHGRGVYKELDTHYKGNWENDLLEGIVEVENIRDNTKKMAQYKSGVFIEFLIKTVNNIEKEVRDDEGSSQSLSDFSRTEESTPVNDKTEKVDGAEGGEEKAEEHVIDVVKVDMRKESKKEVKPEHVEDKEIELRNNTKQKEDIHNKENNNNSSKQDHLKKKLDTEQKKKKKKKRNFFLCF